MASLQDLDFLSLNEVAFPPHFPALEWKSKLETLRCMRCPSLNMIALRHFTSNFLSSLKTLMLYHLALGVPSPYDSLNLPHLDELRVYSGHLLHYLTAFAGAPITSMVLAT